MWYGAHYNIIILQSNFVEFKLVVLLMLQDFVDKKWRGLRHVVCLEMGNRFLDNIHPLSLFLQFFHHWLISFKLTKSNVEAKKTIYDLGKKKINIWINTHKRKRNDLRWYIESCEHWPLLSSSNFHILYITIYLAEVITKVRKEKTGRKNRRMQMANRVFLEKLVGKFSGI